MHIHLDVWMDAVVHGAPAGGAFEDLAVRVTAGQRHGDFELQAADPARRIDRHEFPGNHGHALDGDFPAFGDDPDDRGHAGSKGGSDEICGGKRLAAAVVIHRRIGDENVSGRGVDGGAMKISFVGKFDFDHGDEWEDKPAGIRGRAFTRLSAGLWQAPRGIRRWNPDMWAGRRSGNR